MRIDAPIRATLALSLGVFALSALASNFLLRFLFNLMMGPLETGFEKQLISPMLLFWISGLIGLVMVIVCFRSILNTIRERGLPGFIEAPDPYHDKYVRLGLVVSENGGMWKEQFAVWAHARDVARLMEPRQHRTLAYHNQKGSVLTVVKTLEPGLEGEEQDTFRVKLQTGKKVQFNLELKPGTIGLYESDEQSNYANCYYDLAFLGCDGTELGGGRLRFGGEARVMKLLFLRGDENL